MAGVSRHFTVVDDWVLLNPEITSTEYRVYSIIKGRIRHKGSIPRGGFKVTASWVFETSKGMISVSTAHKAIQGLVKKGVFRRLNDPNCGIGAEFEIVVIPSEGYQGERSVMQAGSRAERKNERGVHFSEIELSGHRSNGLILEEVRAPAPSSTLTMTEVEDEAPLDEDIRPEVHEKEAEFARALMERTARKSETHLRLMEGACFRLAGLARPALDRGWDPDRLAARLAAELNPKIHAPERFLAGKFKDIGMPPARPAPAAPQPEPEPGPAIEPESEGESEERNARVQAIFARSKAQRAARRGIKR